MARDEKQTRIELINPALPDRGWLDALIREDIIDNRDKREITRADVENRSATAPCTCKKVRPGYIEEGYNANEMNLMPDDRVKAMCEDLFPHLLDTGGPHQKAIISCTRDYHANQVMIAMNNVYEKWCHENNRTRKDWYAFQCTPDLRLPADKLISDSRGSKNDYTNATRLFGEEFISRAKPSKPEERSKLLVTLPGAISREVFDFEEVQED